MTAPKQADPVGTRLNIAIAAMAVVLAVLVVLIVVGLGDDGGGGGGAGDLATGGTTTTATASEPVDSTAATTATTAATTGTTALAVVSATADPSITNPDLPAVLSTFDQFVAAINRRDLPAAYAMLGPGQQSRQSFDDFAAGERSTQLFDYRITSLDTSGSTGTAHVSFRSTQDAADGPGGQTCSLWELDEDIVLGSDDVWRIDRGHVTGGSPRPC